jgi:hypothetical protein
MESTQDFILTNRGTKGKLVGHKAPFKLKDGNTPVLNRRLRPRVCQNAEGCLNEEVSYTEATGFFGAAA